MSHEIQNAVFSAAEGAGWTGLGQSIPADIASDPRKIAELCGATFTVAKYPIYVRQGTDVGSAYIEVPDHRAIIHSESREVLSIVSENKYSIENRQPVDIFESFRDELKAGGLVISHAAVLRGGRIIAVCGKLGDKFRSAGGDVLPYVTGSTGYDKAHGTVYFATSIRTVCANTLAMGMHQSESKGNLFRATASQALTASSLNGMLKLATTLTQGEAEFFNQLSDKAVSIDDCRAYWAEILDIDPAMLGALDPVTKKKLISTRTENQLLALAAAYSNAPGAEAVRGTLYGALQAVTYFVDHQGSVRDTTGSGKASARVASAMFGRGASIKARAVAFAKTRVAIAA